MTELTYYLAVFVALGVFFLLIHLLMGKMIRPARPEPEKLTIYECGEPTVGSAWVQFDLRYYVIALLFVIFDVEVAFFFPWALVFGKVNSLTDPDLPPSERKQISAQLAPGSLPPLPAPRAAPRPKAPEEGISASAAQEFAWLSLVDILVFFGVLLVGFAYLWRRGDIDWVRSIRAEEPTPAGLPPTVPPGAAEETLVAPGPAL
jgi:NADH-quinone oxidoreductase subunit A